MHIISKNKPRYFNFGIHFSGFGFTILNGSQSISYAKSNSDTLGHQYITYESKISNYNHSTEMLTYFQPNIRLEYGIKKKITKQYVGNFKLGAGWGYCYLLIGIEKRKN